MQTPEELQQAIQRHEGYVKHDAANPLLQLTLGDLYHKAGRLDEALARYTQCLTLNPSHAAARSRITSVMISQHRFAEAEKTLKELIDGGESDAALLHNLGLTLYYQHRFEEAARCFADAGAHGLGIPANAAYLARTYHHLERMDEAIAACRQWVEQGGNVAAKSYLALLEMDDGNTERAREIALTVLAESPQDIDANVVVGASSVERQETKEARAHFETALRQDRENGRAWLGLGLVHLHEQEHRQAIEALANAARIYPDNPGIIVTLGWAKIIAKDPAGAEQTFQQALNVNRNFSESHGGLAAAHAFQGKLDQAQAEINLAVRLDPKGFGAEIAKTAVLALQGQKQNATEVFARMLERAPKEGALPLIEQLRIYSTKQPAAGKPATKPGGGGGKKSRDK